MNIERDFYEALRLAHAYVKDRIAKVTPPVQFWLNPGQTLDIGAGDTFDKATLLCSILIALGNLSSKIITASEDAKTTTGIYCEHQDRILYADLEGGIKEFGSKAELLEMLGIRENGQIAAYEFNDRMYNDLA